LLLSHTLNDADVSVSTVTERLECALVWRGVVRAERFCDVVKLDHDHPLIDPCLIGLGWSPTNDKVSTRRLNSGDCKLRLGGERIRIFDVSAINTSASFLILCLVALVIRGAAFS
jgi:hypothetical protein